MKEFHHMVGKNVSPGLSDFTGHGLLVEFFSSNSTSALHQQWGLTKSLSSSLTSTWPFMNIVVITIVTTVVIVFYYPVILKIVIRKPYAN